MREELSNAFHSIVNMANILYNISKTPDRNKPYAHLKTSNSLYSRVSICKIQATDARPKKMLFSVADNREAKKLGIVAPTAGEYYIFI